MAKGGKVQHWKHGWIPLTAWARSVVHAKENGDTPPPKPSADDARRQRYLDHVNATAAKRAATAKRYQAHQAATADKRAAMEKRRWDHLAKTADKRAATEERYRAANPNSLGERIKPDPTEMMATARSGGAPYSAAHIDADGNFTPERQALHRQIIEDHLRGITPTGKQPVQYMNGGGPGSGKSSLRARDNAKLTGYPATRETNDMTGELDFSQPASAVLIDPDAVKMMLPEVKAARAEGASDWAAKAHEESSYLGKRIHAAALDRGLDLVYDGTGDGGLHSVQKKVNLAREKGYRVEGNYIYLDPAEGVRRAESRGKRTGRVVAPSVIAETYKDVSSTFGKVAGTDTFDVLRVFDNNQPSGPAKLIASFEPGKPDIKDPTAYQRFLAHGK